jgi:cell division septum initiation protein DivIVA
MSLEKRPSVRELVDLLRKEVDELKARNQALEDALKQLANSVQPLVAYLNSLQAQPQSPGAVANQPQAQAQDLAPWIALFERLIGGGGSDKISAKIQDLALDLLVANIQRAKAESGIMDAIGKAIAKKLGAEISETVEAAFE